MDASYTESKPDARRRAIARGRPFVVARYRPDRSGQLRPELPDQCFQAIDEPDGRSCSIRISYFRLRKAGPDFALAVCRCRAHGIAFTIYPPAFGPYLRQPVMIVGSDGEPVRASDSTRHETSSGAVDRLRQDFEGTLFDAALAATRGEAWARDSEQAIPDQWWSTQGRKLNAASHWLGIATDLQDEVRVRIAHLLTVPVTRLRELGRQLTGYRARGEAITTVLRQLRRSARLALDLLCCAWQIGRWGRPLWWTAGRGFRPLAFSRPAMPAGP